MSAARNMGNICEARTEVKYELSYWVVSRSSSPQLRWSEKDVSVSDTLQLNLCSLAWTGAKGRKGKPRSHQRCSPANRHVAAHRQETTRCDWQRRIRVGNKCSIHILNKTQQASFPMSSTFGQGIGVPINIFVVMLVTKSTSSSISRLITANSHMRNCQFELFLEPLNQMEGEGPAEGAGQQLPLPSRPRRGQGKEIRDVTEIKLSNTFGWPGCFGDNWHVGS